MSRPCWANYRAPCRPFVTGCRQCGTEIPGRRAYCSVVCQEAFEREHFWGTAAAEAIRRARPFGPAVEGQRQPWVGSPVCGRCGKACDGVIGRHYLYGCRREAEVNHKVPLNGHRPHFGCCHHQANLEVVCHGCHVEIGVEQRRAGLIGRPLPEVPTLPLVARP